MSWFSGGQNPSDKANEYLNQIPDTITPYYQPWIDAGKNAQGQTSGIYDQMTSNPNEYYNKLASGYKQSPGYQFKLDQALSASNNAQAAGGMAGSPQHQQLNMQTANGIASQDFNDYLTQVLGINKTGLQGEENALTRGYNASTGLADNLGSNLGQQGKLAYEGAAGKNASHGQMLQNIFTLATTLAGGGMGGLGGLLGGAMGGGGFNFG